MLRPHLAFPPTATSGRTNDAKSTGFALVNTPVYDAGSLTLSLFHRES
jgi:hypothetical protein